MPCELCNDLEKRVEDDVCLAFEFTPDELAQSAYEASGGQCDSCIIILEAIRQFGSPQWTFKQDVKKVYARCREKRCHTTESLSLELFFKDDQPKLLLEFYSLQPHAWKAILPRPSVSGHPLSPLALKWVRTLLNDCTQTHVSCSNSDIPNLPKRLISIQHVDGSGIEVKLVENQENESGLYAALSHCWGTEQACTTTTASLDDRKANIGWESIPKTFQDAIKFALALDLSLVWIDSLCIIQDDTIDWETESSKMADIYQHAFITLAATSSSGDADGCFPEEITPPSYVEIAAPESVADTSRIAVRKTLKHWDDGTMGGTQKRFPLLSRAWALQERLLAPRILHFSDTELVWECRELTLCECGSVNQSGSPCGDFYDALKKSQEENKQYELDRQGIEDMLLALELQGQEDELNLEADQENETFFNGLTRVKTGLLDPTEMDQGAEVTVPSLKDDELSEDSGMYEELGEQQVPASAEREDDQFDVSVSDAKAEPKINHNPIVTFQKQSSHDVLDGIKIMQLDRYGPNAFAKLNPTSENVGAVVRDDRDHQAPESKESPRPYRGTSIDSSDTPKSTTSDFIILSPSLAESYPTADRHGRRSNGDRSSQEDEPREDVTRSPKVHDGFNVDAYLSALPSQGRGKARGKTPGPLDEVAYQLWPLRYDVVDKHIILDWDYQSTSPQDILRSELKKHRPISMDIVQHYHRIVERYSALGLTRPSDKLPALSGLCARLRHMRGDFCAGLWLNTLAIDLMWRVNTLDPKAEVGGRASPYRGPTWSWVSIESPVAYWSDLTDFADTRMFLSYDTKFNDQTLDVDEPRPPKLYVRLSGRNAFGEVSSCSIEVWGLLKYGHLQYTYLRFDSATPGGVDITKYNIRLETRVFDNDRDGGDIIEIPFFADYPLALDGPESPYYVPDGHRIALLLLYPTVTLVLRYKGKTGGWERIGIARISNTAFYDYKLDWMRGSILKRVVLL